MGQFYLKKKHQKFKSFAQIYELTFSPKFTIIFLFVLKCLNFDGPFGLKYDAKILVLNSFLKHLMPLGKGIICLVIIIYKKNFNA
ncbi:hypothetical protein BpHYR1_008208 [Brachionus plicatilis]|uniref:Uncharacterized protein n=1 Tax=Brachionus plicatilis TaxID=10195 RepID=A0A3M7Q136_BRAPC|nr:hypothetical protein BpHYR1_008208 [Brachionus plicatilis]